jgi:hypothetical protein
MKRNGSASVLLLALLLALALGSCQNGNLSEQATPTAPPELLLDTGDQPNADSPPFGEATNDLEARLELPASLPNGERVPLRFTLYNRSDEKLYLLRWFTPLEDSLSEVFSVRMDGERVYFRGWLAGRGDPSPADYVAIEPGDSVTTEIELARFYRFADPGRYEVELLTPMFTHLARSEGEMVSSIEHLMSVPVAANKASTFVAAGLDFGATGEDPGGSASQDCGECPNPLVAMLLERDIEGDLDRINEMMDEFWAVQKEPDDPAVGYGGWEAPEQMPEEQHGKTSAWLDRGINALLFRTANPCAKIIPGGVGYDSKNAKYIVSSKLGVEFGNGTVMVKHRADVTADSEVGLKSVSKVGTWIVHADLIALKNGQVYDSNETTFSWVQPAPWPQDYWSHTEWCVSGAFGPGAIPTEFEFEGRDIGTTIRKKETPTAAALRVDDSTHYPPYYALQLTDIMNEYDEVLPNNVRVALRVDRGELVGGEKMDGWMAFNTQDGRIQSPVLYEPPQCPEAASAKLEIAEVCEWHDGDPSPGEPRVTKRIPLRQCTNWAGTLTVQVDGSWSFEDAYAESSYEGRYSATANFLFVPDDSGTEYLAQGPPTGSYNSDARQETVWPGAGSETATCSCDGGYAMDEYSQSSLYINGNEYSFAFILIGGEDDCEGELVTVDGFGNVDRHEYIGICSSSFVECCGVEGASGTFSGNTIQGECTVEVDEGWHTCTWDFHRE